MDNITQNLLFKLVMLFVTFSFLGFIFEYIFYNKNHGSKFINNIFGGVTIPLLPIYGISMLLLLLIYYLLYNYNLFIKVIVALVTINVFECVSGKLSYYYNGVKTWNYDDYFIPMCDGFISIETTIWYAGVILCLYIFLDYMFEK